MTKVKFCGITRPEDAVAAVALGADAIGLVFYPPSPRYVALEQAQAIIAILPPFVSVVGLFVDAKRQEIQQHLEVLAIDTVQLHGNESPEDCQWANKKVIKALRVHENMGVTEEIQRYADAGVNALLLDAYQKGVPGGTGQAFNWRLVPQTCPSPIILAGGLEANNVASAITQVQPYAVDVSGGIEACKGIKDKYKMRQFMAQVRSVK